MPISFACECGQKFRVDDAFAGKKVRCKACSAVVEIPGGAPAKSAGKNPAAKKPAAAPAVDDPFAADADGDAFGGGDDEFDFGIEEAPSKKSPRPVGAAAKKKKKPVRNEDDDFDDEEDEAPKKKKKKKQSEEPLNPALIAVFALLALLGLGGLGYVGMNFLGPRGAVKPVEKQYATFTHDVDSFKIDYPTDWEVTSGGGSGGAQPFVQFEGDGAYVRFKSSLTGSLIGGIAQTGADMGFAGMGNEDAAAMNELEAVQQVHDLHRMTFEADYSNYEEGPAQEINNPGWGEGRKAEFSGSSGFSSYKGIRATFLSGDRQFNVIFKIKASQYDEYKGVFEKMLASFRM